MSTTAEGEYKWILHIVDHFSGFSSRFSLRSKYAVEVAKKLALWNSLFGPPHILQCDNGTEFKDTGGLPVGKNLNLSDLSNPNNLTK